jgi:cell division protein FtsB
MKESSETTRGPRPLSAFFVSLGASALLLGLLLLSDRRVFELQRGRAEIRELDRQIAETRRENDELRATIETANRHELPAEKVAREELNLVQSGDLVLLYPPGSLSGADPGASAARPPGKAPTPTPRPRPPGALDAPPSLR